MSEKHRGDCRHRIRWAMQLGLNDLVISDSRASRSPCVREMAMVLLALVCGVSSVLSAAPIHTGQSSADVRRILGAPKGSMQMGSGTIWTYENGTVEFEDDLVTYVSLRAPRESRSPASGTARDPATTGTGPAKDQVEPATKAEHRNAWEERNEAKKKAREAALLEMKAAMKKLRWPEFKRDYISDQDRRGFGSWLCVHVEGSVGPNAPPMLVRVICRDGWGHDYALHPMKLGTRHGDLELQVSGQFIPAGSVSIYVAVLGYPDTGIKRTFDIGAGQRQTVTLSYPKSLESKYPPPAPKVFK